MPGRSLPYRNAGQMFAYAAPLFFNLKNDYKMTIMKTKYYSLMCALLLVAACGKGQVTPTPEPEPQPEPEPVPEVKEELKVGSFNIRFDTDDDTGTKDWAARKANVAEVVKTHGFDVFGIQEALYNQQNDLISLLPSYSFYFVGRNNGITGEAVGVGYDPVKFILLDKGRFWLSDTPDTPSNSLNWNGMDRNRVAAWVHLSDAVTEKEFYVLSTHLEVNNHGIKYDGVREKSAELIINRMKSINTTSAPVFVLGDLNPAAADEAALELFRAEYQDTFRVADEKGTRKGPKGTFQGFNVEKDLNTETSFPGDYIFCSKGVEVRSFEAITDTFDDTYPSDHLPVVTEVSF